MSRLVHFIDGKAEASESFSGIQTGQERWAPGQLFFSGQAPAAPAPTTWPTEAHLGLTRATVDSHSGLLCSVKGAQELGGGVRVPARHPHSPAHLVTGWPGQCHDACPVSRALTRASWRPGGPWKPFPLPLPLPGAQPPLSGMASR